MQTSVSFHHRNYSKIPNTNLNANSGFKVNLSRDAVISPLNISSKHFDSAHNKSTSVSYTNTNPNNNEYYTQKISKLEKEKNNLILKNNEQKVLISNLQKENEKLKKDLKTSEDSKSEIQSKYDTLKENQDQLVMLLKLVEKEGVNLENIISKWNSQMDEEEEKNSSNNVNEDNINNLSEGEKENNEEDDLNDKEIHSDDDLNGGEEFLPLTLGENNINSNTVKIKRANVPKLDFGGIKLFADNQPLNDKDKKKKGLNNYEAVIKKK